LARLRKLLGDSDADTAEVIDELEAVPGLDNLRTEMEALCGHIDSFDFDAALEALAALDDKLEKIEHG